MKYVVNSNSCAIIILLISVNLGNHAIITLKLVLFMHFIVYALKTLLK